MLRLRVGLRDGEGRSVYVMASIMASAYTGRVVYVHRD